MITFFTTAKPFRGHAGITQRNTLQSWKLLHPDSEVILFGDDEGAAEAAQELGLRHESCKRHPSGLKYIDWMFDRANEIARHDLLCYSNCDIIQTPDLPAAAARVRATKDKFLIIGRRWDTDVTEPLVFSGEWAENVRRRALACNHQCDEWWVDYFLFTRNLYYKKIPNFVIGRIAWDSWLTWYAKHSGAALVDVSDVVCAVHQNHDYSYHAKGKQGVWNDEMARRNWKLAGGYRHMRSIKSATYRLAPAGLLYNRSHHLEFWRFNFNRLTETERAFVRTRFWHPLLDLTRPLRARLGLRSKPLPEAPAGANHTTPGSGTLP